MDNFDFDFDDIEMEQENVDMDIDQQVKILVRWFYYNGIGPDCPRFIMIQNDHISKKKVKLLSCLLDQPSLEPLSETITMRTLELIITIII